MCGFSPCDSEQCSWGERHRFECEARDVMMKPFDVRHAYYRDVMKRRGEVEAKKLVSEVDRQWGISQEANRIGAVSAGKHRKSEGQK